jgi:AcrR family transcriptional regulator
MGPSRPAPGVDPTLGWTPPRRPGRPARTSMPALVEAAIAIGLDTFTLTEVAARVGVGESTVYNYVVSRNRLFVAACAEVFARLDIDIDAEGWTAYVDEVAERCVDLAGRHPGLRDYILLGPYEPSTIATFEALIDRVRGWLPGIDEHLAFVVASRPVVASLSYLGDPVFEPVAPWLRQALLRGLDDSIRAGTLPPVPDASWRTKLRAAE